MRIAFYAPLKSPNHPVPSGDRLMARLLTAALRLAGHTVDLASELRARASAPEAHAVTREAAAQDVARLSAAWRAGGAPDLFFCYHPYYKAPDFVGPALAAEFGIPYVTAEASMSPYRIIDAWAASEATVRDALRLSALSICFTRRDRDGALRIMPDLCTAMLEPFLDPAPMVEAPRADPPRIVTVAMMRAGDKHASYAILAEALTLCLDLNWTLMAVGDGEVRADVHAMFAALSDRIEWAGECAPEDVPAMLARGDLYAWPGVGEAYGLAYLEAQAAGLPVVAQAVAGVPEVVRDGETGLLTPPGDTEAFAAALRRLMTDAPLRRSMGASARRFVVEERSLGVASIRLKEILARFEPQ